jgi:tripartite-type tricarboxylate transporter receptor subunit TctC
MRFKETVVFLLVMAFLMCSKSAFAAQAAGKPSYDEKAVADFYRGKTVRIVVGYTAGGGYDQYSRVIARHLSKYIPGNPVVIVDNMAGAGSIVAANHVYNVAPKNGTVIGNIGGPIILEQLFANPGVQFDMAKFRYLAVPVRETFVMLVAKNTGVTKFEELLGPKGKQVVVGAIPGSTVGHAPILVRDVLGANLKVVSGYKGASEVRFAVDSGEVDAFFIAWVSVKMFSYDKVKNGELLALAQFSENPLKDSIMPNVPTISQFAKTSEHRLIMKYGISTPNDFSKVYVLPPGTPADRSAALENAFAKVFSDRGVLADADKGKLEIEPLIGEEIHELVREFLGMSPDLRGKLQVALQGGKK